MLSPLDRTSATAPTFTIDASPHTHYAVEVTSDWQRFQAPHDLRNDSNFYGSWRSGPRKPTLSTGATFTLPVDV